METHWQLRPKGPALSRALQCAAHSTPGPRRISIAMERGRRAGDVSDVSGLRGRSDLSKVTHLERGREESRSLLEVCRKLKSRFYLQPWLGGSVGWSITPTRQKVLCLIPNQGTYLGCVFNPWSGHVRATDQCFSLTSMFLSLKKKISEYILE